MLSWPLPVVGHGFGDAGPYPVPLQVLLLIALLALVGAAAVPARITGDDDVRPLVAATGPRAATALRVLAVLLITAIVVPAALGSRDVAANPAPRLLFTVGWAGLLAVSALVGPVWSRANPLQWASGAPARHLPPSVGMWPAVVALLAFTTAEQVLDPSPLLVLVAVAIYVLGAIAGATAYGDQWFSTADPLDRASYLFARLAPVGRGDGRVVLRGTRRGVATTDVAPGTAAFLGLLIAASAYDAAAPAGGFALRLAVFLAAAAAGAGVLTFAARPSFLAAAFIPAAAAHAGAHYLAPLLVDTQVAAVQASDPFGLGWNLVGLTGSEIVAEPISPLAGMTVSYVLLVAGHALSLVVAKDLAAARVQPRTLGATLFPARVAIALSLAVGVDVRMGGA